MYIIYIMFEQNIPFYIYDFNKYSWKVHETEHYIFHVEENSLADFEIQKIIKTQETAYKKIVNFLRISESPRKIKYYFYSTPEKKKELMGDSWFGQSIYNEFTIHAIYNENDRVIGEHEDTHLLSLEWGLPISFFQEGLAEYMVGKSMFGKLHNDVLVDGLKRGLSVDVVLLMDQDGWLGTDDEEAEFYYSIAGSFVGYAFNIFGLEVFRNLYISMSRTNSREINVQNFLKITGRTILEVETEWLKSALKS